MKCVALLLPFALAACASGPMPLPPPDAEVRPVVARDNLDGRWTVAAVNGTAQSGLFLELNGTNLRVALACNGGGGTVSRNGDKLSVAGLALTERACAPDLMRIDEQVGAILTGGTTMEYMPPDRLRLISGSGTLDLIRQRS